MQADATVTADTPPQALASAEPGEGAQTRAQTRAQAHAHPRIHGHGHEHGHEHAPAVPPPSIATPSALTLLMRGAGTRVGAAGTLLALLWLAVAWALGSDA